MASGVGVTRRRALGLVGRLGLGVGGAAAEPSDGRGAAQNPQMRTAAASDQAAALDEPAVVTERRPYSASASWVEVRYATDLLATDLAGSAGRHDRGDHPRVPLRPGDAVGVLERFAQMRPHINVRVRWPCDRGSGLAPGSAAAQAEQRTFAANLRQFLGPPEPPPPPLSSGPRALVPRLFRYTGTLMLARFSAHFSVEIRSRRLTWCCSRRRSFCASSTRAPLLDDQTTVLARKIRLTQPEKHFFVPDSFTESGFDHSSPQPATDY